MLLSLVGSAEGPRARAVGALPPDVGDRVRVWEAESESESVGQEGAGGAGQAGAAVGEGESKAAAGEIRINRYDSAKEVSPCSS